MQVDGKVAFITGGGSGIGAGIAAAFAERGMRLVLADIDLPSAKAEAAKYGDRAIALQLDVASPESWASARTVTLAHFEAVDVLCNNAGVMVEWRPLVDVPFAEFDRAMRINAYGVFHGVQTFGPDMIARRAGHIVNMSSLNGLVSPARMSGYSATKFAVTALTAALRQEMAEHDIGVTAVYPGRTKSAMVDALAGMHPAFADHAGTMDPLWVGRATVKAIEQNLPHVITHPHTLPMWEGWSNEITASFGEPAQPDFEA